MAKTPLVNPNPLKHRRLDANNSTNPNSKLGSIYPNSEVGYKVAENGRIKVKLKVEIGLNQSESKKFEISK